jgi:hypothetical protein
MNFSLHKIPLITLLLLLLLLLLYQ